MSCFALLRVYFFTTYGPRFVCVVKYDDTNRHWLIWLMIYTTITTMLVKHLQKPLASIFCGCYAAHPILVASPLAKLDDDVGPLDWTEDKCGDDRQPEFFAGRVCSLVLILFCCKWGYDNYIYIYIHILCTLFYYQQIDNNARYFNENWRFAVPQAVHIHDILYVWRLPMWVCLKIG